MKIEGGSRQTALGALQVEIKRAEGRVAALKTLERLIPWDEIDEKDESNLWNLVGMLWMNQR